MLGSCLMRSRLCLALCAVGFGLVWLCLTVVLHFIWSESTAALWGRCWLILDDGGALRCGAVRLALPCLVRRADGIESGVNYALTFSRFAARSLARNR